MNITILANCHLHTESDFHAAASSETVATANQASRNHLPNYCEFYKHIRK